MAEVATAHLLLLENTRETSTEKRQKREEKERANTPFHRSWDVTPAACEKQTGKGWVARHSGLLALWPSGCGTGSCLFFTDTEGSDLAGSCLALRTLTTLGLVWPSGL